MTAPTLAGLAIGDHRLVHDCKPNSRTKPLHVKVESAGYVYTCHRCGESGGSRSGTMMRAELSATMLRIDTAPRTAQHATLSEYGRDLWASCQPIAGTAREYLEARGCVIPPADGDLRYHEHLHHPAGYEGAALVGLVTDAISNVPISLHRTWIKPDGTKANVDPPRLLLKGHRKAGGVIRLWPNETATRGLAIAEGIETALAAAHVFTPVWSTIDAGNMARLPVLAGIDALTIFADHDDAGRRAAGYCGHRWAHADREVWVITPNESKTDINDVVRSA